MRKTRVLQRGWREHPPFSKCCELRCVQGCERHQSPTGLERQESTTLLQVEGRQRKTHPSYPRIADIASSDSNDYRDLPVLHWVLFQMVRGKWNEHIFKNPASTALKLALNLLLFFFWKVFMQMEYNFFCCSLIHLRQGEKNKQRKVLSWSFKYIYINKKIGDSPCRALLFSVWLLKNKENKSNCQEKSCSIGHEETK